MTVNRDLRRAISWFAQSLITGDFGPDDSRDSRAQLFLNNPSVVGQAMQIFLFRLEVDEAGHILNHDQAEQRVRQFIECILDPGKTPEPEFGDEELGIESVL